MKKKTSIEDYKALLESLEIPVKPLGPRSRQTPELDVIKDIRERFGVPVEIDTLEPLAEYLTDNVPFDDFFSFLGYLIRPFARMVVNIYDFLGQYRQTATSTQTISEIQIGSQTAFPVDLSYMPREWLKFFTEILTTTWNVGSFGVLVDILPPLHYIAICDGQFDGRRCRPDCLQKCRGGINDIVKDVEAILQSDSESTKLFKIAGVDSNIIRTTNMERESEVSPARLPEALIKTMHSFLDAFRASNSKIGKSASDCIIGQDDGVHPEMLYTQKEILRVRKILDQAKLTRKVCGEALKEFLKLPYWRHRNDLYEVWVLTKLFDQFPHHQIQLCNIDPNGRWNIPGNGQGKITEPILRLSTPTGYFNVFTGLKLKGFQFNFEKSGRAIGAMPDWLFCREVGDKNTFDFSLLGDERKRFEENGLIPEFIIECKAGASYGLIETLTDPMVQRYLPLLRTERGLALLVNYRMFDTTKELNTHQQLRNSLRHKYKQILAIEKLAPGEKESEEEFLKAIREAFSLTSESLIIQDNPIDLILVFDTTVSMESLLHKIREQLTQVVNTLNDEIEDLRVGIIAVGDHCDEPHSYAVKLHPLSSKTDEAVSFIQTVQNTQGGDEAEAYEDALHVLAILPWRAQAQRIAILIGDAYPHSADECPHKFVWQEQIMQLKSQKVKINGIRLSDNSASQSKSFFDFVCSETGGEHIQVDPDSDILKSILDCINSNDNIVKAARGRS